MVSIFDVAKYILESQGEMTAMKLQKLTFYVKVWSLVWDEVEIFKEEFHAWSNGAISPILYERHKGMFKVSAGFLSDADSKKLTENEKDTIHKVLEFYGKYTAQQLIDINHQEQPWIEARGKLKAMEKCNEIITTSAMCEYYSGL